MPELPNSLPNFSINVHNPAIGRTLPTSPTGYDVSPLPVAERDDIQEATFLRRAEKRPYPNFTAVAAILCGGFFAIVGLFDTCRDCSKPRVVLRTATNSHRVPRERLRQIVAARSSTERNRCLYTPTLISLKRRTQPCEPQGNRCQFEVPR